MERVLVSTCLLGSKVRYNGSFRLDHHPVLARWQSEGRIVQICPEVAAGFSTPRPPAEIQGAVDGHAVLQGHGRVIEQTGSDVTHLYREAGQMALDLARETGCRYAVLTDGSPSCGSSFIYDGSFSGARVAGQGTTTALLEENGIRVFSEDRIGELDDLLTGSNTAGHAG
ncbi:DUF523 domain-containing protein [Mesorhizobium sp. M2D.F.Ca.ET.185.01.1.1]|uniref:DUF523 domain-containing protein n=1 Tax=unclassified Mesorhizobium TaxID=325217 RepID=UPI000FCB82F1|nr:MULTISPECIES: DUF523 domain-containing protein [unclassified Mesorhizobium]TGP80801.1 DUF523 domain-containing protein [bacterium M00.F.Ca.ET.227.01.1.1]TGP90585.1 DUF523 domain-containing protein [bacterium M00.F.Ca.ET.221.01.1.1]TGP97264.1 DUF523 domain-containing protein [bacterium M00.F.Ca.ET.222.01.1.1]TGU02075.1 DUF523 domain-containing protein [bacterium M00.F.Ca.ET.163.01.1.1]TGU26134.1 DUF523 domain-containing protein [bacterium M00.F.Ca.ET.156.01.1.1]TGU46958.1 DUF523 domain-cont